MTKTKTKTKIFEKIYMVITEEENKIFSSFAEAEIYAKDECEKREEDVFIYEIHKAWNVDFPEEPQPSTNIMSLAELIE